MQLCGKVAPARDHSNFRPFAFKTELGPFINCPLAAKAIAKKRKCCQARACTAGPRCPIQCQHQTPSFPISIWESSLPLEREFFYTVVRRISMLFIDKFLCYS